MDEKPAAAQPSKDKSPGKPKRRRTGQTANIPSIQKESPTTEVNPQGDGPGTQEEKPGKTERVTVTEEKVTKPDFVSPIPDYEEGPKRPKVTKHEEKVTAVKQAVDTFVVIANGMAEMSIGPDARMSPVEQVMISDPLQRIIERYDIDLEGRLSKYADPVILLFGVLSWVNRIRQIEPVNKPPQVPAGEPGPIMGSEVDFSNLGPPDEIRSVIG
jgi:hypothetical protein